MVAVPAAERFVRCRAGRAMEIRGFGGRNHNSKPAIPLPYPAQMRPSPRVSS
jgi:hypothetical protein